MPETPQRSIADAVGQAREQLGQQLQAHTEELQKLEQDLQGLRKRQQGLQEAIQRQLDTLSKFEPPSPQVLSEPHMESVLAAVRNLITATLPEQVLDVLTEEAEQMRVRAAVFDVRGKAAWGSSARGFGPELTSKVFRTVAVPLNPDSPFRQVYETCGHADLSAHMLKKNKNVLEKLRPAANDPILLLPIRSAGSVSAIFYADPGGKNKDLPVNALKILAEFAGAQLDRLMALSGDVQAGSARERIAEVEIVGAGSREEAQPELPPAEAVEQPMGAPSEGEAQASESAGLNPSAEATATRSVESAAPVASRAGGLDVSQLSEADQKVHKDAKRFSRLLVSEIELYNKAKVGDGRKNKDLYKRLKADIDRSRQTYEKRFGKTVAKRHDYLHDELVRTLASADPSVLGPDYPGPSA